MKLDLCQVNVAIQVLPFAEGKKTYDLVDAAIAVIEKSGYKYRVTPFETVVEGPYDAIMELVKRVQEACYSDGAQTVLCNLKIQSSGLGDVTIEDKVGKYDAKKGGH